MHVRKLIAWNIRKARVSQDLAQEKLAVDASVDRTYVSRLERGLENPSILVLDRLARALGLEVVELFKKPRPGERPPSPLRSGRRPLLGRAK